jgi:alpha-tubulin suppressor-like RCC1 family protein
MSESTLNAPYLFKGGTYPGTGGTCATTLNGTADGSNTCTLEVTFTPTVSSSPTDTITLDYNTGLAAANTTRALTGQGALVTQVLSGTSHTCALYDSGHVKCWGRDDVGQLGDDAALADSATPVLVSGITTATQIAAGANHTCARLSDSNVQCWGSDSNGQLGDSAAIADSATPVAVSGLTTAVSIGAGDRHSCAFISATSIKCWGADDVGQLGNGATTGNQGVPFAASGIASAADVVSGGPGSNHTCYRRSDNALRCFGSDSNGQLGNNTALANQVSRVTVSGVANASAIRLGATHTCAMLTDATMKCWGSDASGQLGENDGSAVNEPVPIVASGVTSVSSLALGQNHTCYRDTSSNVKCFGADASGELGNGDPLAGSEAADSVSGVTTATSIGSGGAHSCIVLSTGVVQCWGDNGYSEIGDGTTTERSAPVNVLNY